MSFEMHCPINVLWDGGQTLSIGSSWFGPGADCLLLGTPDVFLLFQIFSDGVWRLGISITEKLVVSVSPRI